MTLPVAWGSARDISRNAASPALWLALVLFLLMATAFNATAQQALPALTGRVVDNAHLLDPASEAALVEKLAAFERKSSDQIVVATVDSTDGESIESYANRLFREWKLGQASDNNGILLLIAKNDRKMRIEVGYGLEGTVTDLHSSLIINNVLVPAFRAGDFAGGITQASDDIISILNGHPEELEDRFNRNKDSIGNTDFQVDPILVIFLVIWGTMFFGGFALAFLAPIYGKKLGPGRYHWLGMDWTFGGTSGGGYSGGGGWSGGGGGWSSGGGGGGFSGGGGSSGGGGASGGW